MLALLKGSRAWAANRYFSSEGIGSTGCDRCFRICAKKYSIFSRLASMDSFEADNLRSVGRREISPLNSRAIPQTIIATPIVFISNAQKGIVGQFQMSQKRHLSEDFRSHVTGFQLLAFRSPQPDHLSPTVN